MGRGFSLVSLFLSLFFFTQIGHALERNCAGVVAGIYPLGGEEPVVAVEAILGQRGILRYTQGLTVQQLIKREGHFGLVAVRDESVAGFLVAERKSNYVQIVAMAVSPTFERQGVGRELMDRLVDDARKMIGTEEIRTIVAYDDTVAKSFFGAMDLKETEVIRGRFDGQTVSGVLLKRKLADEKQQLQLQLAPKPQPKPKVRVAVETIAVTAEELLALDPILSASQQTASELDRD